MNPNPCSREEELLTVLMSGQWPDCCDADLREHVEGCAACRDLAVVAGAVLADRRRLEARATPLSSGGIWWRMQLRREREARTAAARTVLRAQSLSIAVTIVAVIVAASVSSVLPRVWMWLVSAKSGMWPLPAFSWAIPSVTAVLLVVAAWIILAPVALYLAIAKE